MTALKPKTTFVARGAVGSGMLIIVLVVCREFHAVLIVIAIPTITILAAFKLERVAGVSAVSRHFQSIFVVELVADLERPVLGRVPEIRWPFLYFNSQAVRLRTGQKVHSLKTEPVVGISGSKPSFVVTPRQIPVEGVAKTLLNDDPAKYGHGRYKIWQGRYCDDSSEVHCNKTCETLHMIMQYQIHIWQDLISVCNFGGLLLIQGWLIEQGLTSHQTHYRSYRGRFLQVIWPNQQYQSTEGNQLVLQIRLESQQDHSTMLQ